MFTPPERADRYQSTRAQWRERAIGAQRALRNITNQTIDDARDGILTEHTL